MEPWQWVLLQQHDVAPYLGEKRSGGRAGRTTADHEDIALLGILHDDHAAVSTASTLASSAGFAAGAGMLSGSLIARLKSRIPLPSAPPTSPSLLGPKMIKMTNNRRSK
jgi:hypothetical protein